MGNPGKFEGCHDEDTARALYDLSLEGCCDDEAGSIPDDGFWAGLLIHTGIVDAEHAIVSEDEFGFFDYEVFDTEAEARSRFMDIAESVLDNENMSEI